MRRRKEEGRVWWRVFTFKTYVTYFQTQSENYISDERILKWLEMRAKLELSSVPPRTPLSPSQSPSHSHSPLSPSSTHQTTSPKEWQALIDQMGFSASQTEMLEKHYNEYGPSHASLKFFSKSDIRKVVWKRG
jgi:hypothetical protein